MARLPALETARRMKRLFFSRSSTRAYARTFTHAQRYCARKHERTCAREVPVRPGAACAPISINKSTQENVKINFSTALRLAGNSMYIIIHNNAVIQKIDVETFRK